MKKNGYTVYDMLILVALLALTALIVLPNISNALKVNENRDSYYQEILKLYEEQAEKYGNDKKEEVKEHNDGYVVSIDDLIKADYIGATSENGEIIDIRDNTTKMNNVKFKLTYHEDSDKVSAEVLK